MGHIRQRHRRLNQGTAQTAHDNIARIRGSIGVVVDNNRRGIGESTRPTAQGVSKDSGANKFAVIKQLEGWRNTIGICTLRGERKGPRH